MRLTDGILRMALTAAHKALKAGWFVRRPRTYGAHAIALTRERKLVLQDGGSPAAGGARTSMRRPPSSASFARRSG